jgi:lipopolysaccharide export system permease protein
MTGRTLFAYFFRRYLLITGQFFIGVLVISFLVDFTEFSRRVGSLPEYTIGAGMLVSALRLPLIVQTAVPFIILFSAMSTLMTLNRKYELVIARAAGVSAWQFLAPLCLASLLVGAVTITAINGLAARALAYAEEIETSFSGPPAASAEAQRVPWLRQRTDEGVTIIGAKKTARRGRLLAEATFIRFDQSGAIAERLDARAALLGKGVWILTEVKRLDKDGNRSEVPRMTVKSDLQPEFVEEQFARPETIPLFELREKIDSARSFGLSANAFSMQYHSLLALPLLLVAMTLIAATVSMRFARLGQSASMILGGVMAGFLLYVVSVLVKAFGSSGFVPPMVAAWFPVVVAAFFGVTFLLHKEDG